MNSLEDKWSSKSGRIKFDALDSSYGDGLSKQVGFINRKKKIVSNN